MKIILFVALSLCGAMLPVLAATLSPVDAYYQLVLHQAIPTDKPDVGHDLRLYLDIHDGKVVGALAQAPTFNKMPAILDITGVKLVAGALTGTLQVTIASDGWVPKNGKAFVCEYTLDATVDAGKVTGKWNGRGTENSVTGSYTARTPEAGTIRLKLACQNALNFDEKLDSRKTTLVITLRDGKGVAVRAIPAGSIADVACEMETREFAVTLTDGKLAGTVKLRVIPQNVSEANPAIIYDYSVTGQVIGEVAGGTLTTLQDGKPVKETGSCMGTVRRGDPPALGDCQYKLTLHNALGAGKFIDVYLSSTGGKLTGGFASSPNFNNAMHLVDLTKLTLADGKLAGELGITVLADPWIPADHQPIACSFTLDTAIEYGEITGTWTYAGTAGKAKVTGKLDGALDDKIALNNITGLTIRLENGLAGAGNHLARAFVGIDIKDGKIIGGNVSNNHDKTMKGNVTGGEFKLDGDHFTLNMEFTLLQSASATAGKYVTTAEGTFVGTMSAGAFTCTLENGQEKNGSFWAALKLGTL